MRKVAMVFLTAVMVFTLLPERAAGASSSLFDTSRLATGVIGVRYDLPAGTNGRIMITYGAEKLYYRLAESTKMQYYPLLLGDGSYKISILSQVSGNKYRVVESKTVQLKLEDENRVYLNAIFTMDWEHEDEVIKLAEQLTEGLKSDKQKAKAIHEYIVKTIGYDYELAKTATASYIPSLGEILEAGEATCYGYSALYGGMLRSLGIPAKLVVGDSSGIKGKHAWNEVYLDGEWQLVDVTVDYAFDQAKKSKSWTKAAYDYEVDMAM